MFALGQKTTYIAVYKPIKYSIMNKFNRTNEGVYTYNSGVNNYFTEVDFVITREKRPTGNWVVRTNFDEILCITHLLSDAKSWVILYAKQYVKNIAKPS